MKRLSVLIFVTLFALSAVAAGPVLGKVDVPFTFHISDKSFQPGVYQVRSIGHGLLRVETADREGVTVQGFSSISESAGIKLVFHRYGNDYFLREIQEPTVQFSVSISVSKAERIARQQNTDRTVLALNAN